MSELWLPDCGICITPGLQGDLLAGVPPRIARRLDADPGAARAWPCAPGPAGAVQVQSGEQTVTLRPSRSGSAGGVLTAPGQLTCTCLLAPRCFHLAAVASALPVADAPVPDAGATVAVHTDSEAPGWVTLTTAQRRAAQRAWDAAATVLATGAEACGTAQRGELLQCAHQARAAGLHRLAAAATRVSAAVLACAQRSPGFTAAGYTAEIAEFALTAWTVTRAGARGLAPQWVGTARRTYGELGTVVLHGLACERVVTTSGFAGVTTYFADEAGTLYEFSDIRPGDASLVADAYRGGTRLGGLAMGHHGLGRSRIFAQHLTATPAGRLGSGAGTTAARMGESSWAQPPLRDLFYEPADRQRLRDSGPQLVCLRARTAGAVAQGLLLRSVEGIELVAVPSAATVALLRALAAAPVELWAVAKPVDGEDRLVTLLAVGPPGDQSPAQGVTLRLPDSWAGRLMVGLDALPATITAGRSAETAGPEPAGLSPADSGADPGRAQPTGGVGNRVGEPPALALLRATVSRAALGGRPSLGPASTPGVRDLAASLRRSMVPGGAAAVEELHAAALRTARDFAGEARYQPPQRFAQAWLVTYEYLRAVTAQLRPPGGCAGSNRASSPPLSSCDA